MVDIAERRMRVFVGPNGSGKSTIIKYIRDYKVKDRNVQFGYYINADDIARILKTKRGISFKRYGIQIKREEFIDITLRDS